MRMNDVVAVVAKETGIPAAEIRSTRRTRRIFAARAMAMKILHEEMRFNLSEIGRHFRRDHTSVRNALQARFRDAEGVAFEAARETCLAALAPWEFVSVRTSAPILYRRGPRVSELIFRSTRSRCAA